MPIRSRDTDRRVVLFGHEGDDPRHVEVGERRREAGTGNSVPVAMPPPVTRQRVPELNVTGGPEDADTSVADHTARSRSSTAQRLSPSLLEASQYASSRCRTASRPVPHRRG
jgi:hypothetical protein